MSNEPASLNSQRGISLMLVLFILIVVSLLVAAMVRLNTTSQKMVGQEILSVRALYAAESGAQSAAMRIFPLNATSSTCPANFTINYTTSGLNGCVANIACTPMSSAGRSMFTVSSEGICDTGTERARRRVVVGLRTL